MPSLRRIDLDIDVISDHRNPLIDAEVAALRTPQL